MARMAAFAGLLGLFGCPSADVGAPGGSGGTAAGSGGRSASGGAGGGGGTGGSATVTGGAAAGSGGIAAGSGGGRSGGAGGANSGSGAAGGSSGGTGGGAKGCAAPGLLFCDDFESAAEGTTPGAPRWSTAFNGSATITVDGTTSAHGGTKSVHVKTAGSYQAFLVLSSAVTFPTRAYFRTFLRLGAPMTAMHNTYFKSGAAATISSDHETRVGVMNSMLIINQPAGDRGAMSNKNYYNDGNKPGVVFTPLAWVCVEVMVDPPKSEIDIWVDGKEVPDLHLTDWQQDPVGALRFGFEKYSGPDVDIWYDEIAVSAQPIGCD